MNEKFMLEAFKQAEKAYKLDEVPVGAVIVKNNKILAKAYNTIEKNKNATKHAEIKVIEKVSKKLKNWRLNDCDLYVTLEPCEMCKGAIKNTRMKNVYYILSRNELKSKTNFQKINVNEEKYLNIIQCFFKEKR